MSHRSTILLVTCVTCFGLVPLVQPSSAKSSTADAEEATRQFAQFQTHLTASSQERPSHTLDIAQATPKTEPLTTDDTSERAAVLRMGSKGSGVSEVQTLLKELGYYNGPIDGVYGDATKLAAGEFQKDQIGLPVDGQVGPTTLASLREAAQAASASPEASPEPTPEASPTSADAESEGAPSSQAESARSEGQGWPWWIAGLIAIAALGGFGLGQLKRPSIKRPKPKSLPSDVGSSDVLSDQASLMDGNGARADGSSHSNGFVTIDPANTASESGAIQAEITPISETTRIRKATLVEELVRDLHSPDPSKRRKAIWDLGQVGDSNAIDPLVDLMMDSDSSQRSLILAAISEIGIRTLKPLNRALLISLQDRSPEVRKNAIRDITRVYDLIGQMSELLAHAAADNDDDVRETAHWALGQLNRIRNIPELGNGASLPPSQTKAPEQLSGDSTIN